jgi:transposase
VGDSEVGMIIMAFRRGTSKRELAERYGISESSVKRLLRSAGVRRHSWNDRLA